ncbi:MAG: hypothetical protein J5789_09620, partial [Oscillospiraceae bacterium]|nr:hypothetical protein [Oscillospiraceae bacterium]
MTPPESEGAAPAAEIAPAPAHTALTAVSAKKKAPRLETPEEASVTAEPPVPPPADPNERVPVCDVQFRPGSKIYFFDPGELTLKNGDHVVIDTARGSEFGYCIVGNHRIARRELVQPLRRVLRLATPTDEKVKAENEKKEKEAYAFCLKKVEELGLDMQLVSAECAFDGSKLLFFFTADARVDFRELVKILASNFHTRIELRQIGVRDKAKMLGGIGICGRPFCCASFLDDFQPVSIKMAKTQSLSLNPTKISGSCGRLMCCLKYEQDAYEDLIQTSPKAESFVDTPDGRGTVIGVDLMKQSVTVRMEKDEDIHSYRNSEICVLRSGKAKKTDPPIPEDLAPISGRKDSDPLRERRSFLEQRLTAQAEEFFPKEEPTAEESFLQEQLEPGDPGAPQPRKNRRDRKAAQAERPAPEKKAPLEKRPAQEGKPNFEGGSGRRHNRGPRPDRGPERVEKPEMPEKTGQPSRQQRRRQQQGKAE